MPKVFFHKKYQEKAFYVFHKVRIIDEYFKSAKTSILKKMQLRQFWVKVTSC